jgi:ADP-ribosylglycohydrolase
LGDLENQDFECFTKESIMPLEYIERCSLAQRSLEGLSVGDSFGETFFHDHGTLESRIGDRILPEGQWCFTDDTVMAMSIVEELKLHSEINQDSLALLFAEKYAADPSRGYGSMAHRILSKIRTGSHWRSVSRFAFDGRGSKGNGGAMRSGPIGAFFSDDLAKAAEQARLSAEITHTHPEGMAGAIAVAIAAAFAASRVDSIGHFFQSILAHTPAGSTRTGIEKAALLPMKADVRFAVKELGNGSRVLAEDTVPFALWCAAGHLDNYEEALWATVSGLGDRDTTCAIAGSIVALSAGGKGIPEAWILHREALTFKPR